MHGMQVILHADGDTQGMELRLLESYSTQADAAVGSWLQLEVDNGEGFKRSYSATTLNIPRTELPAQEIDGFHFGYLSSRLISTVFGGVFGCRSAS